MVQAMFVPTRTDFYRNWNCKLPFLIVLPQSNRDEQKKLCFLLLFFLFSLNRDRLTVKMSIRIIILCPLTVNLKTQKRPDCQSVFISRLNTNSNNKTSVRFNLLQCLSLSVIDVFLTFLRHFWNFIKLCKLISFCICSSNKQYTIRDYIFQIFYSACPDNCFNYSESLRHERSKSRWLFSSEL